MIPALYAKLCRMSPRFNTFSRRLMYQFMARHYQKSDWTFMNFGYAHLTDEDAVPDLNAHDEDNRFCIQLYHHVAGAVNLTGLKVLEIGSGRGGGSAYIKRYLQPRTMIGMDFSQNAVMLCRKTYAVEGLTFLPGNAENLPFDDQSFDAVVNVESSHCYGVMEHFLAEVRRVLRVGGHFLFADFRDRERLPELETQLLGTGMQICRKRDITPNVVGALDQDHARKLAQIRQGSPQLLAGLLEQFAGIKGTRIYERFKNRLSIYQSFVLQK
ncbi:MAG: class I SAM-dependent methyltransferase [Anaerolineae bacterium]|nr:class I SAM-dependent methyltransferase [Anaerolineae bacterium]